MLGIAVATHNRRDVFNQAIQQWLKHRPDNCVIVVVDDGSTEPVPNIPGVTVIRHDYAKGIAAAKNRCITELMDLGCQHLFLADDDCWPTADNWWRPYVESPEPHLMFQWPKGRVKVIRDLDGHQAYSFPRGVMLYAERRAIDTVGGMDTGYGAHGGEHVDWSQRIHDAKLTTFPFMDVKGSHQLWYSRDKTEGNGEGSSRFGVPERRRMCEANGMRWSHRWPGYPLFPYREHADLQDYGLGPRLSDTYQGTLDHVLGLHPFGCAVEFGVGEGHSLRRIAATMPVVGFDSFEGLPEHWRDGFDKGTFACQPPDVPNAALVQGWFADTLPKYCFTNMDIGLWHLDADLYSSTATILDHIGPHILPGSYIVFDEYHGYPGHEDHEMRAWRQYVDRTGIGWVVVGHGPEAWAIRIT